MLSNHFKFVPLPIISFYNLIECQNITWTKLSGVIESPNFPAAYPHYANCLWNVVMPTGNKIDVSWAAFNMESHSNCMFDRLQVRVQKMPNCSTKYFLNVLISTVFIYGR